MNYKICNHNHGIKINDTDLKTQIYQMNHSDLNIILYEMYDRKGCALCGIKNVFSRTFWPEFEGGGFGRGGGGFGENYPDYDNDQIMKKYLFS